MTSVYLLPVAAFVILQVSFISAYIAAVMQEHVLAVVPYISDAANYSPQSCFFGQMINMGSILLMIITYIRYQQVSQLHSLHPELGARLLQYNWIGLLYGLGSTCGISFVANFQKNNSRIIHFAGAFFCYLLGTIYFWLQAIITYRLCAKTGTRLCAHMRLCMAVACTVIFYTCLATGFAARFLFNGENTCKWYPTDGGFYYHLISSTCEWILSTIFCFYILTFTKEFQDIEIDHFELIFTACDDEICW